MPTKFCTWEITKWNFHSFRLSYNSFSLIIVGLFFALSNLYNFKKLNYSIYFVLKQKEVSKYTFHLDIRIADIVMTARLPWCLVTLGYGDPGPVPLRGPCHTIAGNIAELFGQQLDSLVIQALIVLFILYIVRSSHFLPGPLVFLTHWHIRHRRLIPKVVVVLRQSWRPSVRYCHHLFLNTVVNARIFVQVTVARIGRQSCINTICQRCVVTQRIGIVADQLIFWILCFELLFPALARCRLCWGWILGRRFVV